jgi:hypothetical protein
VGVRGYGIGGTFVTLAAFVSFAADRPHNHEHHPTSTARLSLVPVGAIKIPLRDVQQPDEYSCGAAAFMAVASYYNVGAKKLEGFKRNLKTDPQEGTYYKNIVCYAEKLGLSATVETDMGIPKPKAYIRDGKPVICSIQAYSEDKQPDYTKNGNGHYVVAIGYDDKDTFYFMDPAANWEGARANPRYGCLTKADLECRWHEDEGSKAHPEPYSQLGIIVLPKDGSPLLQARWID